MPALYCREHLVEFRLVRFGASKVTNASNVTRRDPRVVFSCLGNGNNAIGMREYLIVHGKARITEGGAPELLQRLAHLYPES